MIAIVEFILTITGLAIAGAIIALAFI